VKIPLLATATILGLSVLSLPLAMRGSTDSPSTASGPGATRQPADLYFVTQTSLGTLFQIDSGRLAQPRGRPQPFAAMRSLW
jgi:hypothetical protein